MRRGLRITLASLVIGASLAVAVWLYSGYEANAETRPAGVSSDAAASGTGATFTGATKGDWQDPVALVVVIVGVGIGAAFLVPWRRTRR